MPLNPGAGAFMPNPAATVFVPSFAAPAASAVSPADPASSHPCLTNTGMPLTSLPVVAPKGVWGRGPTAAEKLRQEQQKKEAMQQNTRGEEDQKAQQEQMANARNVDIQVCLYHTHMYHIYTYIHTDYIHTL